MDPTANAGYAQYQHGRPYPYPQSTAYSQGQQPSPYPVQAQPPQYPAYSQSQAPRPPYYTAPQQEDRSRNSYTDQSRRSRPGRPGQEQEQDASLPNAPPPASPVQGPGAPRPQASSTLSDTEEELRAALQREVNPVSGQREPDGRDDDDDGDGDVEESSDAVFNIPPPPEQTFATPEELETFMHAWSLDHGYELVKRANKKNAKNQLYKRYWHCSKHGSRANTGKLNDRTRVRAKRKSNRINCPMSLAAVAIDPSNPSGDWQIRHRKTHHNHGPLDALSLAGHRRRARGGEVEKAVDGLFAIGTSTGQVLTFLQRTHPGGLFTRTDVANMKLKFKKNGTCVETAPEGDQGKRQLGYPSACLACRARKTRCDSARPVCDTCQKSGAECVYDCPPPPPAPPVPAPSEVPAPTPAGRDPPAVTQQTPSANKTAEQILSALTASNAANRSNTPGIRLGLSSSTVEVLAYASCGNGDSYKSVPTLFIASDWSTYAPAFVEAAMKENTHDVLVGNKAEPANPGESAGNEEWNEYVKQLAIYQRRNAALLAALWGTVAPTWRTRIQHMKRAADAWSYLESQCNPRGSDSAFNAYAALHNISLQNSADLGDYINRLDSAYQAYNKAILASRHHNDSRLPRLAYSVPVHPNRKQAAEQGLMTEETLCFLFLKNLGAAYEQWVEALLKTSNVAGFGSGPKLGFRDVTQRAVEFKGMGMRRD